MKFDSALPVLAVSLAPVAALGQLPYVGGGGGSLPDVGGAADLAKPGQVTGQLNGLLEGLGLNSLDLSQVLTIDWDNDKVRIRSADFFRLLPPTPTDIATVEYRSSSISSAPKARERSTCWRARTRVAMPLMKKRPITSGIRTVRRRSSKRETTTRRAS